MAIDCADIASVATELKNAFKKCKVLKSEDMDKLIELIEAVSNCSDGQLLPVSTSELINDGEDGINKFLNYFDINGEILSLDKELEIQKLGGTGKLGAGISSDGSSYTTYRHLNGNKWLITNLNNAGEISAGVDTPYKITDQTVEKLFGYITVEDAVKSGTWSDFTSSDSSVYIAHTSTRTFNGGDSLTFTKTFGGDLELFYVGDTDGGVAEITIDGGTPIQVDTYSAVANDYKKSIVIETNIPFGEHTIVFSSTGTFNAPSTSDQVWFNAFKISDPNIRPNSDFIKLKNWYEGIQVSQWDEIIGSQGFIYVAENSGTTGSTIPSHSSGTVSDGGISWLRVSSSSFENQSFRIQGSGSELEYAYEVIPNGQTIAQDVGGNLHGNEFLTGDVIIKLDNELLTLNSNKIHMGEIVTIEQNIEDFHGDYATKTTVANVKQVHQFDNHATNVLLDFEFVILSSVGYFYTAMFPFLTYDGPFQRPQFNTINAPNISYDLSTYDSVASPGLLGNTNDYISWAEGNSFVDAGSGGIPTGDTGEGSVLIALKTSIKNMNRYIDSDLKCALAVNLNTGTYSGYSSWLSKLYFQFLKDNQLTTIEENTTFHVHNTYYTKLY